MRFTPSSALVKQSLAGHSWIGLLVGTLMYLICLSGTLAVFYEELERWEQPQIAELDEVEPAAAERAMHALAERAPSDSEHHYLVFPTPAMPRLRAETDDGGWFVTPDGSLIEPIAHDWTHMLVNLHLYLHLPQTLGLTIVGALGALLCALIVSGFFAHPRIFKDAFKLRFGGSRHLEQADIHNRLSVWGAPFHLIIAVTGAYFGLYAMTTFGISLVSYDGDPQAVTTDIFGDEPGLEAAVQPLGVASALESLEEIAPGTEPIFLVAHEPGQRSQFMDVYSQHPDRLIYGEAYRFDAAGNYVGREGFSDGEIGKQMLYSTYRLHFGHFGGFPVKVLYGVLGMALTIVAVTGTNVWLARRRRTDYVNDLWSGFVWGTPAALVGAAITQVLFGVPSTTIFWGLLAAAVAYAVWLKSDHSAARHLKYATAALLLALLLGYGFRFGSAAVSTAALGINITLLLTAAVFGALAWAAGHARSRRSMELLEPGRSEALSAVE